MPSTEAACKQATRALAVAAPTVRAERVARLATRINEVKTNLAVMIHAKGAFTADLKDMILCAKEAPPAVVSATLLASCALSDVLAILAHS